MSIELDPNPRPVDKLRFRNLRGKVLHLVASDTENKGAYLGSLGPLVGDEHVGKYDLVVGNPPWASGTKLRDWNIVSAKLKQIAAARGIQSAPPIPNEVLDIPFVWRALEWSKPGGQIAFALHARLLFQQGDGMAEARRALFAVLDVTSVINGAELRQTKVWPEISAPFCLLFGTNKTPGASAGFRFITPRIETSLNEAGVMRIDAANAEVVSATEFRDNPEILKILFRGTKSDLGIVKRLRNQQFPTLGSFWRQKTGTTSRGHLKGSGNGYQRLRPSSRIRKRGDGQPGADASYLHGLLEITASGFTEVSIDMERLGAFSHERIHDPRARELFAGPILVVHKSPPAHCGRISCAVADRDVVYNETFYGYSPIGHEDPHRLISYLSLIVGSKVAIWFALMTSGEFGFEREVVEKATLDLLPLPDFETLSLRQLDEISALCEGLKNGTLEWCEVDEWVAGLYGLGRRDLQVISDTLEFNLPFAENRRRAEVAPTIDDQIRFCDVLAKELAPWAARVGRELQIKRLDQPSILPWCALGLHASQDAFSAVAPDDWQGILGAADQTASSEIVFRNSADCLIIGRLAQQRYWSETQARLLAQRIAWSHLDFLRESAAG